jgi:hypothetical protein
MQFLTPEQIEFILAFVIELLVATFAFFLSGRLLSGVNAKFTDAIFVAFLGLLLKFAIDFTIGLVLVPGLNEIVVFAWSIVSLLAAFIVWMLLVQHFFDCTFIRGLFIVLIAFILIFIIDFAIYYIFTILFPSP